MCEESICNNCMSGKYIVIGAIVLVTAMQWPDKIWHVLGGILILKGVIKITMPKGCGHCSTPMPAAGKRGKK